MKLYMLIEAAPLVRNRRRGGIGMSERGLQEVVKRGAIGHTAFGRRRKIIVITEEDIRRYNAGLGPLEQELRPVLLRQAEAAAFVGTCEQNWRTTWKPFAPGQKLCKEVFYSGDEIARVREAMKTPKKRRTVVYPLDLAGRAIRPEVTR